MEETKNSSTDKRITNIQLKQSTKQRIFNLKTHHRDTYDSILNRLMDLEEEFRRNENKWKAPIPIA